MAINAAALQELTTRLDHEYHLYRGNIVPARPGTLLDGINSQDVSYLADARDPPSEVVAHYAAQLWAARGTAQAKQPSGVRQRSRVPDDKAELSAPSGRAAAVASADQLRRGLFALPANSSLSEELPLWDAALSDVARQVQVHCNERGQLLEAIRSRFAEVLHMLIDQRAGELAVARDESQQAADVERRRRRSQMLFARGALSAVNERTKTELEGEHLLRLEGDSAAALEMERLRARLQLVHEQLVAARQKLADLEEAEEEASASRLAPSSSDVYERFVNLQADSQLGLLHKLLLRPADVEAAPAILPSIGLDEQTQLISHLMTALPSMAARRDLLAEVRCRVLPDDEAHLCHSAADAGSRSGGGASYGAGGGSAAYAGAGGGSAYAGAGGGSASYAGAGGSAYAGAGGGSAYAGGANDNACSATGGAYSGASSGAAGTRAHEMAQHHAIHGAGADAGHQLASNNNHAASPQSDGGLVDGADGAIGQLAPSGSLGPDGVMLGAIGKPVLGANGQNTVMPDAPAGGSIGSIDPGGLSLDANSKPVLGADGQPIAVTDEGAVAVKVQSVEGGRAARKDAKKDKPKGERKKDASSSSQRRSNVSSQGATERAPDAKTVPGADGKPSSVSDHTKGAPSNASHDAEMASAAAAAAALEELRRRQEVGELTSEENAELARLSAIVIELVAASDPQVPHGGSIDPGGVIRDASGKAVIGDDGKPLHAPFRSSELARMSQAPTLGKRREIERVAIPLGSILLSADNVKPMSLTFLLRLISNLYSSKLVADSKLPLERAPPPFSEFVSFQMISFYGSKSIATRYAQEMYVGLLRNHMHHPRLSLFARGLGLVPACPLREEAFQKLLDYLDALIRLLERERPITRTTSVTFFKDYSSMCTTYIPCAYVMLALEELSGDSLKADADVRSFAAKFVAEHALPNEAACVAAAKARSVTKRAIVVAACLPNTPDARLVDGDLFFEHLASFYHEQLTERLQVVDAALAKYDLDGDGRCAAGTHHTNLVSTSDRVSCDAVRALRISLGEFKKMLPEMHDLGAHPINDGEQTAMYHQLTAMGDGALRQEHLAPLLFSLRPPSFSRRPTSQGRDELENASLSREAESRAQFAELAAGWDAVRLSTSATDPDVDRLQHFAQHLFQVLKVQRRIAKWFAAKRAEHHRLAEVS